MKVFKRFGVLFIILSNIMTVAEAEPLYKGHAITYAVPGNIKRCLEFGLWRRGVNYGCVSWVDLTLNHDGSAGLSGALADVQLGKDPNNPILRPRRGNWNPDTLIVTSEEVAVEGMVTYRIDGGTVTLYPKNRILIQLQVNRLGVFEIGTVKQETVYESSDKKYRYTDESTYTYEGKYIGQTKDGAGAKIMAQYPFHRILIKGNPLNSSVVERRYFYKKEVTASAMGLLQLGYNVLGKGEYGFHYYVPHKTLDQFHAYGSNIPNDLFAVAKEYDDSHRLTGYALGVRNPVEPDRTGWYSRKTLSEPLNLYECWKRKGTTSWDKVALSFCPAEYQ